MLVMNKSFQPLLRLSGQSLAYGMGVYGRQIIIYLTLPLLTTLMTQQEYGAVSIITSFYTVINTLTNVGLPSATFRIYNDREESAQKRVTLGSSQILFFALAASTAVLIILFAQPVSRILLGNIQYARVIQIVALLLVFDTMNSFGNILLRLQVRPLAASIQSIIFILTQMGTAILFIGYFKLGVTGYWMGYLLGAVVGMSLMIWLNREFVVFEVSRKQIRELLSYGIPLIPAAFSLNLLQLADNYMIRTYFNLEQVAIFAVGYKIGSIVNLVIGPFKLAWPNFAFTTMNKANAEKTYRDIFTFVFSGSLFVALAVYTMRDILIAILAPETYQTASQVVLWIALSMVAYGLYPITSLGPKIKKKTHQLIWVTVFATLLNILLNLILIPTMGINGVSGATFISFLCLVVFSYLVSQRLYRIPLDWMRLGKVMIAFIVTGFLIELSLPNAANPWISLSYKLPALLLYPVLLILLRFTSFKEITAFITSGKNNFLERFWFD